MKICSGLLTKLPILIKSSHTTNGASPHALGNISLAIKWVPGRLQAIAIETFNYMQMIAHTVGDENISFGKFLI